MTVQERIREIKALSQGYHLVQAMRELSGSAAAGDEQALEVLTGMLAECRSAESWARSSSYCSAVVHAVAQTGTLRSMQLLIRCVSEFDEEMPYGAVELFSSILPTYKRIVMGPLKDLIETGPGPARAVGLQSLCNLYLDGQLQGEEIRYLTGCLKKFTQDDYLTLHVADLVRLEISYKEKQAEEDLNGMLDGFLLEDSEGPASST